MSDTTKTAENVVYRRRADDWKKPQSVTHPDPFGWREGDSVAFLDDRATARVSAALNGARTITALLMQHDLDQRDEDGRDNGLALEERTTYGLFEALASCLELADLHATGGNPLWTTWAHADDPEAGHLRRAATEARISESHRRAAEHAALLNKAKAAKKGGGMNALNPTQKKLLAELVRTRHAARGWIRVNRLTRDNLPLFERKIDVARAVGDAELEQAMLQRLQQCRESLIEYRSHLVEIGRHFLQLSHEVSEHLPRAAWLEALSVNRSEWETDDMIQHGDSPLNVVSVLRLENSATQDDGPESRPLAWCCQMALMNAMQTSSKLDQAIHEATNEFFGGAFGEYRERSPLERMGIPAHMIQGGDE